MLVLGGTSFVGRHIVEAALAAGHEVTLFNRGQTNPDLFAECDKRYGDRKFGDYSSLAEGSWDALVDVNAYYPRAVEQVVEAVGSRVGHYVFISTCSVYDSPGDSVVTEDHRLATVKDPSTEDVTGETYGGLKVLCEQAVEKAFGKCSTIIRPGIVAGPHDPTDRFTYWVRRAASGRPILAVRPEQPVQVVHARDQGDFVVRACENGLSGPFNTVGPSRPVTMASMIDACAAAVGASAEVVWADDDFLAEKEVDLPLHIRADADYDGLFKCSPARAESMGFVQRPLVETARDTHEWDRGNGDEYSKNALDPDAEAALIEEWRRR